MDEVSDKLHVEALERFDRASEFERENRELAEEDFLFVSGDGQWPEEVRNERESKSRPCLTMNRLPVYIAQVMGDARQNRPAIKISPVDDQSDPELAEVYEGIIRHIESDSDADIAYLAALQQSCEGGFGHWRATTDYSDDMSFDQDIKIERIQNPFSVYWDNNATHPCKADADWCFITEWITTEAFDKRYPKHKDEVRDWKSDSTISRYGTWLDGQNRVRIAEYWCKKYRNIKISLLPDGTTVEGEIEGAVRVRDSAKVEVVRYVLSGDKVLEGPEVWPGKYIPIVSVYGPEEFVDNRIRYRSIVRHAKDAQRMYNYWQTAITEKIALAPKAPYTGTVEMFKGLEHIWQAANVDNLSFLPYNPDPKAPGMRPERTQPAHIQAAEIQQANQSIDDIKATIGIFDASLGAAGNETSGRAIIARQREGDTATFAWIDNLSRGIEHTGRILLDLIPRIYDSERVIRILGEDGSEDMVTVNKIQVTDQWTGAYEILNDLSAGKYDVRVTVGPSYATKRMEAADSMMQFIQAFPAAAPIAGDLIAKNMDWPGADDIAERLKELLPPNIRMKEASPEEQQMMMQQLNQPTPEQMEAEANAAKTQMDIEKTAEETEGKRLDNMQKSFELAAANGELNAMVEMLVMQNLQQIMGGMTPQ